MEITNKKYLDELILFCPKDEIPDNYHKAVPLKAGMIITVTHNKDTFLFTESEKLMKIINVRQGLHGVEYDETDFILTPEEFNKYITKGE